MILYNYINGERRTHGTVNYLGKDVSGSIFGSEAEQDMFRKKLEEIYGSNPTQEQIAEFAKNYPYSSDYIEAQKIQAKKTLLSAWDNILGEMRTVNLNAAAGSDEYRRAKMNEPGNKTGANKSDEVVSRARTGKKLKKNE